MPKFKRVLLKFSGEALAPKDGKGIDEEKLNFFAQEIKKVVDLGVQIGIVVGGGNIVRGAQIKGISRITGDYMGMLATVINALALSDVLNSIGLKAKVLTSTFMEPYAERYSKNRAITSLQNGEILIFAGGTSNPFFTTDSAAALKAIEIEADILLKGTNVDGVYDDDPRKNPNARLLKHVSFKEVIEKELKVMDLTAFTLCKENNMPIRVFNIHQQDNFLKIIKGEDIGTLVN